MQMMMQFWAFLAECLLLLFTSITFAQTKYPDFQAHTYQNETGSLPYRLLLPQNYNPEQQYPLVIFFHGAGERGTDNEITLTHIAPLFLDTDNRKTYACFVLVPQCPENKRWVEVDWGAEAHTMPENPSLPMLLTFSLIEEIITKFPIEKQKIYLTGLSMGGFAVWDMIARQPEKFAAAVPICGGGDEKTAGKIAHIPIWAFHGALDKVVLPSRSRNMIAALRSVGGNPQYTEFPEVAHGSWVPAYKQEGLLKWLFSQTNDR